MLITKNLRGILLASQYSLAEFKNVCLLLFFYHQDKKTFVSGCAAICPTVLWMFCLMFIGKVLRMLFIYLLVGKYLNQDTQD